ncbi:MAG: 4'-phosphopantetheinyl transferase superfamily protein [Burkholderiaceae bacterium]|nr:4'-phosphopantetheinyl transferase superfamily protein [Burkholderiaceae bacterium]
MTNQSHNLTHTKVWYLAPECIEDVSTRERLLRWLSVEERDRMQKFHATRHQHTYLVAHALVRGALARELGCAPLELIFENNMFGKPRLVLPDASAKLEFNLSHTEGMCVVAVSRSSRVGCDVESLNQPSLEVDIARNFFTPEESEEILMHPPARQVERLLTYWTLKEAYIKAEGQGLSMGLDTFYFSLQENQPPRLMLKSGAQQPSAAWKFKQIMISDHHLFSVAIEPEQGMDVDIEIKKADWLGRP